MLGPGTEWKEMERLTALIVEVRSPIRRQLVRLRRGRSRDPPLRDGRAIVDQSDLDGEVLHRQACDNCPFCNWGSVSYFIEERFAFQWTLDKRCFEDLRHCRELTATPAQCVPPLGYTDRDSFISRNALG